MTVYSEETLPIPVGLGIDSYHHPANLEDGFCTSITNLLADGTSLKTRKGFQPPDAIDTRLAYNDLGLNAWYGRVPNSSNEQWPVAWYGHDGSNIVMLRQFNRDDPSDTSFSFSQIGTFSLGAVSGMCSYLDRLYINKNGTIKYLTSINWTAETLTENSVTGPGSTTRGLFVFKDRMWCWDDTKIYYTDVPASPGAYAETWGSNFVVIGANEGLGKIWNIIPIGTNLYVFTGSGLYTVAVIGSPANWVVRSIDRTASVNHQNSVLEYQGLIYFVDAGGVKVTNGGEVKIISETINDIFEERYDNFYFFWKIFPFEEGLLLLRQAIDVSGTYPSAVNRKAITETKIFYTKFEDINWTQITFNTNTQPTDILGSWSKLETYHNWIPTSYLALGHNDTKATNNTSQFLMYTGYQDSLQRVGQTAETTEVTGGFTTKVVRGEMFKNKRAKYGYLNFSANGASGEPYDLSYNWDTEELNLTSSGTISHDSVSSLEALTKIEADFQWRHCRFNLTFTLDAEHTQYTFLGVGLVNMTQRKEVRRAS